MPKYAYTVFGTATTVKLMKFKQFPKVGQTTAILNTDFDRLYYGGKAWNIAYDMMMLGLPVYPVLAYSDTRFAAEFQRISEKFDAPLDGIFRSPQGDYEFLTCYILEDENKNHITIGGYHSQNGNLELRELKRDHIPIRPEFLEDSRMAVLTCPKPGDLDSMFSAIVEAKIPMAFSMSHDPTVFNKNNLEPVIKYANIIFANEAEIDYIEKLYGYSSITDLFTIGNAEIIVKTLGGRGSLVYEKKADGIYEHHISITKPEVEQVKAVGAGDAYVAGFLYGLCAGVDVATCARYGSTVSSFIIEDDGSVTNAPDLEKMLERYNRRPDVVEML